MRRKTIRILQRHTIWLSVLGHLLLFSGFTAVMLLTPRHELPSSSPQAVPSYLSQAPEAPPVKQAVAQKAEPAKKMKQKVRQADNGDIIIGEPDKIKPKSSPKPPTQPNKVSFASKPIPEDLTNPYDREPLRMIGESKIIKPLVKILARALSRHLRYPRVAADFNLRGIVLVGFVLDPDGYVTEARVVQTSGAGVLDDAARTAVGAMGPVGDVHQYVESPEFLVVGIIFG